MWIVLYNFRFKHLSTKKRRKTNEIYLDITATSSALPNLTLVRTFNKITHNPNERTFGWLIWRSDANNKHKRKLDFHHFFLCVFFFLQCKIISRHSYTNASIYFVCLFRNPNTHGCWVECRWALWHSLGFSFSICFPCYVLLTTVQ